jgi:hypothetical protein
MPLLDSLLNEDVLGRDAGAGSIPKSTVAKREVYIAIRRDGQLGDGTRKNPYNGTNRDDLDAILNGDLDNTLRAPIRFVFGPGIFRTAGSVRNAALPGPWAGVRSGQEFVGSGIFATTLRLEIADPLENAGYGVFGMFGNQRPSDILVQDMTVDCDLANQPPTGKYDFPRIMTHCAGIYGSQIRFRRVRVINYGTRATDFEFDYDPPQGAENGLEIFQRVSTGSEPRGE